MASTAHDIGITASDRLAGLSEQARALGRIPQADWFLLLAWAAFDAGEFPIRRVAAHEPPCEALQR